MRRLLAIEARRSPMRPMIPLLALLLAVSPIARHLLPVALWASRSNEVQSSVQALGPFAAGVAAWAAVRERRRQLDDLLACTPYPRHARWLATSSATAVWALSAYVVVAAVMFAITARQASWGHPSPWPVLSGFASLLACVAVGSVAGRLLPGPYTAPLVAIGVFAAMATGMQWALSGGRLGRLSPIYPSIGESPFFRTDPSLAVAQIVCYLGVASAVAGVLLLRGRGRGAVTVITAGVLLIGSAAAVAGRSRVGDFGRVSRPAPAAAVVTYTPVCAGTPLRICVHPAFRAELPALEAALAPITRPLQGSPVMPTGVAQARPGPPDPSMDAARGTALAFGFGNLGLRGDTITPAVSRINLQTRFALALVTPPPGTAPAGVQSAAGPAPAGEASRVVALYLLRQARDTPDSYLLAASSRDEDAVRHLAALDPPRRRAWFSYHAAALRTGTLTTADLP